MTAHQKAVALFMRLGPMWTKDFAPIMWPTAWKYCESQVCFLRDSGYFLAGMRRRELLRRDGQRRYYVEGYYD